jgi:hypothetical protein
VPTLALNDYASTDETDSGDDALDDPADCRKLIAAASGFQCSHNEPGRTKGN